MAPCRPGPGLFFLSAPDTIVALASGRPPAAIGVIRVSGPRANAAARALAGALPPPRRVALRTLRDAHGGELDRALVIVFDGPATATGEELVELHCHGGRAVTDAVLGALAALPGCRLAEPGEFTRRAFANGRIDLTEAEGLADLIEAETESQRRNALALAGGGLRARVEAWRQRLVDLSARAEAAIDYVGDEEETALDPAALAEEAEVLAGEWRAWLARPPVEPLKDGIRVVAAGPPNAGKSSLINALVGSERVIVTEIPGTTRDSVDVPVAFAGLPLVLVDTAGLRDSDDRVERLGIERAGREIDRADILLWLGSPAAPPAHPAAILVHSKADLVPDGPPGAISVSSRTGAGLAELWEAIAIAAAALIPGEGEVALNQRQRAALAEAVAALASPTSDLLLIAESLRAARVALDRLTGRQGADDMLDALFTRFCLGK